MLRLLCFCIVLAVPCKAQEYAFSIACVKYGGGGRIRYLPEQGAFGSSKKTRGSPYKPSKKLRHARTRGNEYQCNSCEDHSKIQHLEVDHIIAKSKGGTDHIDNLQLLCGHCNRVKGNRGMKYLRDRLRLAA